MRRSLRHIKRKSKLSICKSQASISFRCIAACDGDRKLRFANRMLRFHFDTSKASTHRSFRRANRVVYSGRRKLRSAFRFCFDASKQNLKNWCQGYFNDASKQNRKDQPISGETSYIAPPTNASGKDLGRYLWPMKLRQFTSLLTLSLEIIRYRHDGGSKCFQKTEFCI